MSCIPIPCSSRYFLILLVFCSPVRGEPINGDVCGVEVVFESFPADSRGSLLGPRGIAATTAAHVINIAIARPVRDIAIARLV